MGKTSLITMTEEKVKTCIENLVQIMKLKPLKLIHDGEVSPEPAEITKYNLREAGDYRRAGQLLRRQPDTGRRDHGRQRYAEDSLEL